MRTLVAYALASASAATLTFLWPVSPVLRTGPAPPPLTVAEPPECDLGDMEQTLEALRRERTTLRTEIRGLEDALAAHVGAAVMWPEVGELYAEPEVTRQLPEAFSGEDVELLGVSCVEYPCLAVVQVPFQREEGELMELLSDAGYSVGTVNRSMSSAAPGHMRFTVSLPDPAVPEDVARTAFRAREMRFLEHQ